MRDCAVLLCVARVADVALVRQYRRPDFATAARRSVIGEHGCFSGYVSGRRLAYLGNR